MRITPLLLVLLLASPVVADEPKVHRGLPDKVTIKQTAEDVAKAIRWAHDHAKDYKGKNIPPFLILHVADHPETRGQSQRLVKVLQEAGISAKAYPAEGKNHTTINYDLGLSGDRPTQEMFGFLTVVLTK